jgi:hypothetical protein
MAKTLTQISIMVGGLGRGGFALAGEDGFTTYYDLQGNLLVGAGEYAPRHIADLGEVTSAREFESLSGVTPMIWETACGWCGRLTLVAAGEEDLCPRCSWRSGDV